MPDPLALSARDAAREIAAGRLSAVALVEACFDRIAAREPVVGAWHHLDRAAADAACVALARAAGAIVLGKTVTTEFACFTAGKTVNPHNPAHTPGGSSSGSAAAVAAGMVPL